MTTKKDAKTLAVTAENGKSEERQLAEVLLSPNTLNAITAQSFIGSFAGELDLAEAVTAENGKSEERQLAEVLLSPNTLNAITAQSFIGSYAGELDLTEAVTIMQEKSDKIISGDLNGLESTLTAQVVSLNSIFNTLARRSANNMGNDFKIVEVYMRLALKAQTQCARTIEVLAAIKNPPMVYARQANIAHGHQQVNNAPAHAGKTINSKNELLQEDNHGMDTRAPTKKRRNDTQMETVGKIHGSKDNGRQGPVKSERL